jgi:hypothetical protein
VATPNRALNVVTSSLVGSHISGGASLEMSMTDESSGKIIFAASCNENAKAIRQFTDSYSVVPHTKYAIEKCIQQFEKAIN